MTAASKLVPALGLVLAATLLAGCGDDPAPPPDAAPRESASPTPSPTTAGRCSAAGMSAELPPQAELPEPVAATRDRIAELAVACDYEGLAELGRTTGTGFSFSFGADVDAAKYWRKLEKGGREPVTEILVQVLGLPSCSQTFDRGGAAGEVTYYSWPAAFCENASDEDWAEVEVLYTPEEIEQMKAFGGYIGWRVGITDEGDWAYFIAGD